MSKKLRLYPSSEAIISDEDYAELSKYKWHISSNGYAIRTEHRYENGIRKTYQPSMHRIITSAPSGKVVDHLNRDKLDNRRENLRVCTQSDNNLNAKLRKDNSSGVRGVRYKADHGLWLAEIGYHGKTKFLGHFKDMESAIIARKEAESRLYQITCV